MNKKTYIRFLSLFLCLAAILSYLAPIAEAANREQPLAVLWAGSDIQGSGTDGAVMSAIVENIKKNGYSHVDEAFFLGDYADGFDTELASAGTERVRNILNNAWGLDYENILMVQGNHAPAATANQQEQENPSPVTAEAEATIAETAVKAHVTGRGNEHSCVHAAVFIC